MVFLLSDSSIELRCVSSHQAPLDQFNQEQIDRGHRSQEEEVEGRQRLEAERPSERRVGEQDANRHNRERRDRQRETGTTVQRIDRRPNNKQHERLRGERFDEPARMEEHVARLEDPQQQKNVRKSKIELIGPMKSIK